MSQEHAFERFSWLSKEQQSRQDNAWLRLCAQARDITAGATEVLCLLEAEGLAADFTDDDGNPLPRVVPASTGGSLQRMAITSLELITERIDKALADDAKMTPEHAAWLARAAAARAADMAHAAAAADADPLWARVRQALACIPADVDDETCELVGSCIKATLGERGRNIWETWCSGRAAYSQALTRVRWVGFEVPDAGDRAALEKLVALAEEIGPTGARAGRATAAPPIGGGEVKKSPAKRVPRGPKRGTSGAADSQRSGGLN
ncbi:PriCT-2 domain-containing protein [Roseateles sp.]|uniref:PriCT-2 domain-containing protein n=1 Tax=Roseateles sp. TaxID=1971397 RepID=UPI003955BC86